DGYGPVTFWLLPYTFPEKISAILSDDDIRTYDQALRKLIESQNIDTSQRNIIVSHQNVVANGKEAERGGSESMAGGVGQIDYSVYGAFDYAALGHIHSSYSVGREEVRYAGTPLCYHLAETRQKNKGFVEIVINAKGEPLKITQRSITPLHKMRFIKDTRDNIYDILRDDSGRGEYIGITITDQRTTPEINAYLKELLNSRDSVLLELLSSFNSYANTVEHAKRKDVESLPIEKLFENLYTEQCGGTPPTEDEYKLMEYVGELVRNQDTHMELDDKDVDKILNKAKMIGGSK
ncbi:MAG: hypothetical protein IIZ19_06640, partial [Clostridia bacterium]|nr:hypothetical protein [Clostridia bacterium]